MSSFLQLSPERERQILCKAEEKDGPFPSDTIVDILSEYNVTSIPTASSLPQIIKQVSRLEMIHKPFFLLEKIRQGMGNFWIDITKGEMEEIYCQTMPNAANGPPAIIVKFTRRDVKENFYHARKQLKDLTTQDLGYSEKKQDLSCRETDRKESNVIQRLLTTVLCYRQIRSQSTNHGVTF